MSEVSGAFLRASAVLKSAPKTNRSALAEAILASRKISDEFLLDPLIDGRKLLASSAPFAAKADCNLVQPVRSLSKHGRKNFPGLAEFYFLAVSGFCIEARARTSRYAILRKPPLLQKYPVAHRHGTVQVSSEAYRKQENRIRRDYSVTLLAVRALTA